MDSDRLNDIITIFTMTASPLTSIVPLGLMYKAYSDMTKDARKQLPAFEVIVGLTPILVGAFHAILYVLLENVIPRKVNSIYVRFVVTGALGALCVSLLYHAWFDIYTTMFAYENLAMVHAVVFVAYLVYFYTIGCWVRWHLQYYEPGAQQPKPINRVSSLGIGSSKSIESLQ